MTIFVNYAKYYDLLNAGKNYRKECDYIEKILKKFNYTPTSILDFGCGTGQHSIELFDRGYNIHGVDLSNQMIKIAKEKILKDTKRYRKNIKFDSTKNFGKKEGIFDASISLFHVINYHTSNYELKNYLKILSKRTKVGGLIIFDYWYSPAVQFQGPEVRVKEAENTDFRITRISFPNIKKNIIEVKFKIFIENKKNKNINKIDELHSMRPLEEKNLIELLPKELILLKTFEWMTFKSPSKKSWNVVSILKKLDR